MNINEHQWTSMNINKHQWTSMSINEHQWTSMNINEHQWTSMNINEHQWTSMSINEHQWTSMNINEHQWSSMSINEHQWTSMSINEHQWTSMNINEHQWTSMNNELYHHWISDASPFSADCDEISPARARHVGPARALPRHEKTTEQWRFNHREWDLKQTMTMKLTCKREFQSAKNEDLHWKMEIEILKI